MTNTLAKPARSRASRIARWAATGAAIMLILVAALYLLCPWWAPVIAAHYADRAGFQLIAMDIPYPGIRRAAINTIYLQSPALSLHAQNATLAYKLRDLIRGDVKALSVESLHVILQGNESTQTAATTPSIDTVFSELPLEQLDVETFTLALPEIEFIGSGHFALSDSRVSLFLAGLEPDVASRFQFTVELTQAGDFNARFSERTKMDAEDRISVRGTITSDELTLNGDVNIDGYALTLASALAGLPAGTGVASASFQTTLPWPVPPATTWREIVATIPKASVEWLSEDGDVELSAIQGSMLFDSGAVDAVLSGHVLATINDSDVSVTFPGDYKLSYRGGRFQGGPGAKARIRKPGSDIQATLRAFDAQQQTLAALALDADIDAKVDAVRTTGRLETTLSLTGEDLNSAAGTMTYNGSVQVAELDYPVSIQSAIEIIGDEFKSNGTLTTGVIDGASLGLTYNLENGAGLVTATNTVDFTQPLAAALLPTWQKSYDLDAGRIIAAAEFRWTTADRIAAKLDLSVSDSIGHYEDYLASGIEGGLVLQSDDALDAAGWQLQPATLRVQSIDVGLPIREVTFGLSWADGKAQVQDARAHVLGGQASITPFEYVAESGSAAFEVTLTDVELAEVLALEGEDIQGTGRLDGRLPVSISNDKAQVSSGEMAAQAQGGTIRLTPSFSGPTGQPGLDFALLALKDFTYSELRATIEYSESGDLQLGVRLLGRNPGVENGRPIRYNLNISENIPVLLESLRLQDSVTREVERKVRQ